MEKDSKRFFVAWSIQRYNPDAADPWLCLVLKNSLRGDYSLNPEPGLDPESPIRHRRQINKKRAVFIAINVFFGVVLIAWPLVYAAVLFGGDNPPTEGPSLWLYEYVSWTCRVYPLIYVTSLFVGIHEFIEKRPGRAMLVSAVPAVTAYPWFTLYLIIGLTVSG